MDVYSDWIDACDAVAKEDMKNEESGGRSAVGATQSRAPVGGDEDDDY